MGCATTPIYRPLAAVYNQQPTRSRDRRGGKPHVRRHHLCQLQPSPARARKRARTDGAVPPLPGRVRRPGRPGRRSRRPRRRTARPPRRQSAEPVAAHVAADEESIVAEAEDDEPVWIEPVAEAAPPKTAGRKTAEGRTFAFPVLVTRDPDRVLRGRMDAELTDRGLHLRKPRQQPAFAAVGGKARYLGANRLVVTVEGREVELVIDKPWTSNYHLARDVAGFLNGQRGFPERRAYTVPWYLYCPAGAVRRAAVRGRPLRPADRRLPRRLPLVRHRRRPGRDHVPRRRATPG